ncbi:MAG: MotA/TolQ/ExbB proton channel family protein [Verrucomicrobiaceae bacterium]
MNQMSQDSQNSSDGAPITARAATLRRRLQIGDGPQLAYSKADFEARLGVSPGRLTAVNRQFSFAVALCVSCCIYAFLWFLRTSVPAARSFCDLFFERGWTQQATVFFTSWAFVILIFKRWKLAVQKRAFDVGVPPRSSGVVIDEGSGAELLERLYHSVDDPRKFALLGRAERSLHLAAHGLPANEVRACLKQLAEADEDAVQRSFNLLGGIVWVIPVLGFVGTVLGLGQAVGGFGATLQSVKEIAEVKNSLIGVTQGLSTAFDTTLLALLAAILVQMWNTFQFNKEQEFMAEVADFCEEYIAERVDYLGEK